MNSSNFSNQTANRRPNCVSLFLLSDSLNISLTVVRLSVAIFYIVWILFAIKIKEFHTKNMVYLYNLNAMGIVYCLIGLSSYLYTTCTVFDEATCAYSSFSSIFTSHMTGYGLSALTLFRLACFYKTDLKNKMNTKIIIITLALIWTLPTVFTFIQIFSFEAKSYFVKVLSICFLDSRSDWSFIFYAFANAILPNFVIIVAYLGTFLKMKRIKRIRGNSSNQKPISPPRITIQLIVYVLLFELNCVSNLLGFYQAFMFRPIFPQEYLTVIRILKWLQHFRYFSSLKKFVLIISVCVLARLDYSIFIQQCLKNIKKHSCLMLSMHQRLFHHKSKG